MRIHHILPGEVETAPCLREVLGEIESRIGDAQLLVHYGKLDVGFLKVAYRRHDRRWHRAGIVDTVRLLGRLTHLRRQLDPYAESLPADLARARAEVGLPRHVHHHALYDALATAELFLALVERLGVTRLRQLR